MKPLSLHPLLLLSLLACGSKGDGEGTDTSGGADGGTDGTDGAGCDLAVDADCDGVADDADCDPSDALVYPGAVELPYDGKDNDCAGDGDLVDVDGDGQAAAAAGGPDCNDGNPEVFPGAAEICYDGVDQNCDGIPVSLEEETDDCDGDGYIGRGTEATDCNDEDPAVNPAATEVWYDGVDQDCDRADDDDADADGDALDTEGGTDCDDGNPEIYGDAPERLDGADGNCDGSVDNVGLFDAHYLSYGTTLSGDGWAGASVIGLDDYDGDGLKEFAIGGPFSDSDDGICDQLDAPYTATIDGCEGWLQILPGGGPDGDPPSSSRVGLVRGDSGSTLGPGSWFGWDAAALGDVDGDGWTDVVVGAPLHASGEGRALVLAGADLAVAGAENNTGIALARIAGPTLMGTDVAAAGDVDGDGLADVAAGAGDPLIESSLWLGVWTAATLSAGGTVDADDATLVLTGDGAGGRTVGGMDLDLDGIPDLAVGDQVVRGGSAYVVPGDLFAAPGRDNLSVADLAALTGDAGDRLGARLAFADDLDGDGAPDLIVSAPGALGGATLGEGGEVYIISGPDALAGGVARDLAHFTVQGTTEYGSLAVVGDHAGDIDGDGATDLLVSHVGGSVFGMIRSDAWFFPGTVVQGGGSSLATAGTASITTRASGDLFGYSGTLWDQDDDGDVDVLIGAPDSSDVGMVALFRSGF